MNAAKVLSREEAAVQDLILDDGSSRKRGGAPATFGDAVGPWIKTESQIVPRPNIVDPPESSEDRTRNVRRTMKREIPPHFTWARWDAPELQSRVQLTSSKLADVRVALAARSGRADRVVIIGGAGNGKTSLACAYLADRIERGSAQPRFVAARNLLAARGYPGANGIEPQSVPWTSLAIAANPFVLDDLGAELTGAPAGGGLAAQRIEVVCRVLADRHDLDLGHVITTAHEREKIAAWYGDGVARRVFEGALVIRCRS